MLKWNARKKCLSSGKHLRRGILKKTYHGSFLEIPLRMPVVES